MHSQHYRREAENSLKLAELTESEKARLVLVAIAHSWYELSLESKREEQGAEQAASR
jgi:hypothetical protein